MIKDVAKKSRLSRNKKYMLVKYGRMNNFGLFEHNETHIPKLPTRVVVKTDRGLELGYLVGRLGTYRSGHFKLNDEQVQQYFEESQIDFENQPIGKVIRFATDADINEERHLRKIAKEEMEFCKKFVNELDLAMKVIDADHIFGGERIIFYFMSETRVDFRELVKKLAHEYQSRVEMRQIGSRDEAKLLSDIESCGQQCCCTRFLKVLKPVNMRMAKMQKATLDPSKISGYCGRLKCCLRYEDQTYSELKKRLPRKRAIVKTEEGQGKVIDGQILTQLVVVEYEDGRRSVVPVEEIEIITEPEKKKRKQETSDEIIQAEGLEDAEVIDDEEEFIDDDENDLDEVNEIEAPDVIKESEELSELNKDDNNQQ